MPATVSVVEADTIPALLAEPQRFVQTDADGIEPGVAGCFVCKYKDNVDFLERAEGGFWVEEVHKRDDGKVCDSEDDPGAVANVSEGNWRDEHDARWRLADALLSELLTYVELISQLPSVLSAFAGPRILKGTISTWYNHAIPCQPMAKNIEKPKRKTVLANLAALISLIVHRYCIMVTRIMQPDMPDAPNIISERLPQKRSIPTTVTNDARK